MSPFLIEQFCADHSFLESVKSAPWINSAIIYSVLLILDVSSLQKSVHGSDTCWSSAVSVFLLKHTSLLIMYHVSYFEYKEIFAFGVSLRYHSTNSCWVEIQWIEVSFWYQRMAVRQYMSGGQLKRKRLCTLTRTRTMHGFPSNCRKVCITHVVILPKKLLNDLNDT